MKKVLSILLAALMIFGLTVNAFAVQLETPPQYPETSEGVDVVLKDKEIQVIINEGATGDLNVNLAEVSVDQENAVPGDWTDFPSRSSIIPQKITRIKTVAFSSERLPIRRSQNPTAPFQPLTDSRCISSVHRGRWEITYAVPVTTPLPLWILTSVMAARLTWTRPYPTLPSAPPSAKQATAAKA